MNFNDLNNKLNMIIPNYTERCVNKYIKKNIKIISDIIQHMSVTTYCNSTYNFPHNVNCVRRYSKLSAKTVFEDSRTSSPKVREPVYLLASPIKTVIFKCYLKML